MSEETPDGLDLVTFSGLDADTGEPLFPPLSTAAVSGLAQEHGPDPAEADALAGWLARVEGGHLSADEGIDPRDLAAAGWAVLFPPGLDPAVREALQPLLDLRQKQAAAKRETSFRVLDGDDGYQPGEDRASFLRRFGAAESDPANPLRLPYYLLLVGSPQEIPFSFQYQLDVQYAVGRLCFETPAEYAAYAQAVVAAETGPPVPSGCARRITFFGPEHPGDVATPRIRNYLLKPLAEALKTRASAWSVEILAPEDSTKARLARLAGGEDTPAVLFTGCHGMGFPAGDPRQRAAQGALLCQDWPGQGAIPETDYLAAADLGESTRAAGLLTFCFGCHSAGTPRENNFVVPPWSDRPLVPEDQISRFPQRLLARGALAVVGHIERAWDYSFLSRDTRTAHFEEALALLLAGHPVGAALERFGRRQADLTARVLAEQKQVAFGKIPAKLNALWMAAQDARNYLLLGDPAVRVAAG